MNKKQISQAVDSWIAEEELPTHPLLKVIKQFDDVFPADWDEDEFEAYWEFIRKGLMKDYEPLLSLPRQDKNPELWPFCLDVPEYLDSAFNTHDFKRLHPVVFNKQSYRLKKIYERVKDLALTYSCITSKEGKTNTYERFRTLVESEFRDWAVWTMNLIDRTKDPEERQQLRRNLYKLSMRIQECNRIWRENAYQT